MAHDLVIRGGDVVDGTGSGPRTADVAIDDDTITCVGEVEAPGRREIDAKGLAVTPGFVDIHTHLDAQIGWDPMLTPISWHGVTTALIGNCGVTFAPCRTENRTTLAAMMETVEDIPRDAIMGGLPWNWEGYGGYLDALESLRPAINVGGLGGHCALRYYAMGERGVAEPANEADHDALAGAGGEAIDAGAVGFSTSRFLGHVLPDGRHVPGTHAEPEELERIAKTLGEHGGGLMQNVLNLGGDFKNEFDLLRREAEASGDRVLFSIGTGRSDSSGQNLNALVDGLNASGCDVSGVAIPRGSGFVTGLVNILPWRGGEWRILAKLDFEGRLAAIDDDATCAKLIADSKLRPQQHPMSEVFPLGDEAPDYVFNPEQSLQAVADRNDEEPVETFLRLSRESRGRALFTFRIFNVNTKALADLISGEHVLPGLGDAGAHVGQIMDAGWCSFVLSHWVRDAGLFSVGEGIRRMTSAPARIMGLADRGRLEPGLRADVNVIDLSRVRERLPEYVHDFPGGAGRFIQRADGYRATICNGEIILENDEHTGARAGTVLR
nr:amidohydrolase family protein [Pseudomonadota bacterium]